MRAWIPFRLPLARAVLIASSAVSACTSPVSCVLRKGGGLVDAPGRGLLGAKSNSPF